VSLGERVFLLFLALSHFLRHLPVAPPAGSTPKGKKQQQQQQRRRRRPFLLLFSFLLTKNTLSPFLPSFPTQKKINKKQKQLVLV
jgi:hypothetical protein